MPTGDPPQFYNPPSKPQIWQGPLPEAKGVDDGWIIGDKDKLSYEYSSDPVGINEEYAQPIVHTYQGPPSSLHFYPPKWKSIKATYSKLNKNCISDAKKKIDSLFEIMVIASLSISSKAPLMKAYITYLDPKGNHQLIQDITHVPITSIFLDDKERNVVLANSWYGNNLVELKGLKNDKKPKGNTIQWDKLNKKKTLSTDTLKTYRTESNIYLPAVKNVCIYDFGFSMLTDGPISCFVVTTLKQVNSLAKEIEINKSNNNMWFPVEVLDFSKPLHTWSHGENASEDKLFDDLVGRAFIRKIDPEERPNFGQRPGEMIID